MQNKTNNYKKMTKAHNKSSQTKLENGNHNNLYIIQWNYKNQI